MYSIKRSMQWDEDVFGLECDLDLYNIVATNDFNMGAMYVTVIVLYCTVLYCTVLYCTVLYCTVLYCTVLYCTVLYCTTVLQFSQSFSESVIFLILPYITSVHARSHCHLSCLSILHHTKLSGRIKA
jgi:hypothetical protein